MNSAAQQMSGTAPDNGAHPVTAGAGAAGPDASTRARSAQRTDSGRGRAEPRRADGAAAPRRPGLLGRLSTMLGSRRRPPRHRVLSPAARRELLIHGLAGTVTILGVRPGRTMLFTGPFVMTQAATAGPEPNRAGQAEHGHRFWVRVQIAGQQPYETRLRQQVGTAELALMQPGAVVGCRVDPGDRDRMVLYVPSPAEATGAGVAKILADGRRADAKVLAATPVAADYTGRDNPVLALDLELCAWDEPKPWRVRIVQPVPLTAIELVDRGRHLEIAFFTVDRGESVAVDWAASRADRNPGGLKPGAYGNLTNS
jgi:hypothetical protein